MHTLGRMFATPPRREGPRRPPTSCTWCGSLDMETVGTGDSMRWTCRDCKKTSTSQPVVGERNVRCLAAQSYCRCAAGHPWCQNDGQFIPANRPGPKQMSFAQ